ncbi:MAG: DNA-directed RNA polymerase subunit beta, partial [Planctomycetaceae bacterium]|nr:DNA-directed RNA polymerase subunit beta [Planctomycetaceae bacterium]
MATSAQRRLSPTSARRFGSGIEYPAPPDLSCIQTNAYRAFLQAEVPFDKRKDHGLEGVLREIFPIVSYDGNIQLDYVRYELGKPRYTPEECRYLRLTYGMPFRVWLRLNKEQPIEEEVYLGDIPVMLGGGEFIINGAERVVVSQLHRSPGIDFVMESDGTSEREYPSCRVIPERGSWIEINITKKDSMTVRIDQSSKFSVVTLLRAMDPAYSENCDILRAFYEPTTVKVADKKNIAKIVDKISVDDVVYPQGTKQAGELLVEAGRKISQAVADAISASGVKQIDVIDVPKNSLLLNSLAEDTTSSHEEALMRIYQRLRPGNPPSLERARTLFEEKFYDSNRYRLGRVGRFRINRKLGLGISEKEQTLKPVDILASMKYVIELATRGGNAQIDDIDHLGNRRLRTIDELACDEIRKGFLKLARTVKERMSLKDQEDMTPRVLVNPKSVSAAIEYFFGRGELSQVVDQTNPLSQLTHERRLSALGPGGLNRKRAGFEVRDVHISHYGRICPIETPEGANIGLITSMAMYAGVDDYGFLVTPYRILKNGRLTNDFEFLRADQERNVYVAPADTRHEDGLMIGEKQMGGAIVARFGGDFQMVPPDEVQYMDVAPNQMVGVSASLIPFLEHDDANRALMGSNMQRQAVPLIRPHAPIVGTGLEAKVAHDSRMLITAEGEGAVEFVDSTKIVIRYDRNEEENLVSFEENVKEYSLTKFARTNQATCINLKPIVKKGDRVSVGTILSDGYA